MSWTTSRGFSLVEFLVATLLTLVIAAAALALLSAGARAALRLPPAADDQQRMRAAVDQLTGWLASAGEGTGGHGANRGEVVVPVLYPQRRFVTGPDPDVAAFADRVTLVRGGDPQAVASLRVSMTAPTAPVEIDLASCGPGRDSCGFGVGRWALVADTSGHSEVFRVSVAEAGRLEHLPATLTRAYSVHLATTVVAVDARAVVLDRARRQLRLVGAASSNPLLDGVSDFVVSWFGDPRPPLRPVPPPGEGNCVVDADGVPSLPGLSPTRGPWVELTMRDLSDGPWCGSEPWRFDADLLRVRLLVFQVALDPAGRSPSRSPGFGERMRLEVWVAPPNLGRTG